MILFPAYSSLLLYWTLVISLSEMSALAERDKTARRASRCKLSVTLIMENGTALKREREREREQIKPVDRD